MALIKCPECGKEISDKAKACPNCGCPNSLFMTPVQSEEKSKITQNYNDESAGKASPIDLYKYKKLIENKTEGKNTKLSVAALIIAILGLVPGTPLGWVAIMLCVIDLFKSRTNRKYAILLAATALSVLGIFIFYISSSSNDDKMENENMTVAALTESSEYKMDNEAETVETIRESSIDELENVSASESIYSNIEYENIFVLDLKEQLNDYQGKYIRTSFEIGRSYDDYIQASYDDGYFKVYADNCKEFEYGQYVTVTGKVSGEEIKDAHVEKSGNDVLSRYNEDLSDYKVRKEIEEAEYEANFKENAELVSYDDLSRYPDTYKEKQIKVTVKITDVEPDGIILPGHYEAVVSGTKSKLVLYDKREMKEPKLIKGDTAVIYGYGDGLTTIKVQDTSGMIPKTVDKYTIPGINIEFVELK